MDKNSTDAEIDFAIGMYQLNDKVNEVHGILDVMEAEDKNFVSVSIAGHEFEINMSLHGDVTVKELYESVVSWKAEARVEKYLRSKYLGAGVPYEYVQFETHLEQHQVQNWIRAELGIVNLKDVFVPFELVASMVVLSKEES